jgi:hypothetical protein
MIYDGCVHRQWFDPLFADLRFTTQALHWDRGRPARREHAPKPFKLSCLVERSRHVAVLVAGGTPAVPVKSLSGETQVTTRKKGFVVVKDQKSYSLAALPEQG